MLLLPPMGAHAGVVNIRPLVPFSILDHHIRRDASQDRVIGALLGTVVNGGVDITDAFGVYHTKRGEEEVLVRKQTLYEMLELHRRVSPKEVLVGWYSTWTGAGGSGAAGSAAPGASAFRAAGAAQHMDEFTLVVHEFFAEAAGAGVRPLHLLVDVSLRTPTVTMLAHRPIANALLKKVMVQFTRLRVNIVASPEERVGLDAMARAAHLREGGTGDGGRFGGAPKEAQPLGEMRELSPDLQALEASLRRLRKLLDAASRYCDEVASGAREGDEAVGRALADTLAAVPPFDADAFSRTFGRSVQDLLMASYLATLTQAQIKLSERIAALPISGQSSAPQVPR